MIRFFCLFGKPELKQTLYLVQFTLSNRKWSHLISLTFNGASGVTGPDCHPKAVESGAYLGRRGWGGAEFGP